MTGLDLPVRMTRSAKPRFKLFSNGLLYKYDHFQTRIKRAGVWNKPGCMNWYYRGCPEQSTFVFDSVGCYRLIVGYDPKTDELILGRTITEDRLLPSRFPARTLVAA